MVQAGRMQEIEQALADLGAAPPKPAAAAPKSSAPPARTAAPPAPPVRSGPSPFELDQRKRAAPPPTPSPAPIATAPAPADSEWRDRIHTALMELGMAFTADAVEHSEFSFADGELLITTPREFKLAMKDSDLQRAIRHLGVAAPRLKLTIGEVAAAPQLVKPAATEDEVTRDALANPEVRRFREVFGGEIRTVRNLKE